MIPHDAPVPVIVRRREQLDPAVIERLALGTGRVVLDPELVAELAANRRRVLADLEGDQPVYGVNTGMGAQAGVRLDATAQARHQDTLMVARAVGSAPWLRRDQARALLAVRLRTLLHPAAGVSPELCQHLIDLLDADVVPAIPAHGNGAAGEIIPLAHAGAVLLGTGQTLAAERAADRAADRAAERAADRAADRAVGPAISGAAERATEAGAALTAAGLRPRSFGAKEGVAFLEGVPGQAGLAVLAGREVRLLVRQVVVASAAAQAVVRASRDPLHPALADSDELATVLAALRAFRGDGPPQARPAGDGPLQAQPAGDGPFQALPAGDGPVRALQAPVSFRVAPAAVAVVMRAAGGLDAAVLRALNAVTDSPAHLDGRFVGSAGFAGTDLTATSGALTTALAHLAEIGTAQLHRLLDPAVTGLPRQLSDAPGLHAGMVTVHKRAVGVVHRLRRFALPALGGAIETSLGQEDVQSFGFEAAECLGEAVSGLRDVLACQLLSVHQAIGLDGPPAGLAAPVLAAFAEIAAVLPAGTGDRPFGRDLDRIIELLVAGWAGTLW